MHYCVRRALDRFESLLNNMLPRLRQHLHRHIIRDHILLDQRPHELILCLRRRRESYLDLLKPDIDQHLEELQLLFQAHRLDQRLVAVTQIDAAPDRRLINIFLLHPVICDLGRHKIRSFIFVVISHDLLFLTFHYSVHYCLYVWNAIIIINYIVLF